MKIIIKPIGVAISHLEKDGKNLFFISLPEKSTIEDALNILSIPENYGISYMMNGNHAKKNTQLEENDELIIMSMLYGG